MFRHCLSKGSKDVSRPERISPFLSGLPTAVPIDDAGDEADNTEMLELVRPDSPELWDAARQLVEEYAAQLKLDLSFQDFQHEIEGLAREYGPPDGCFLLVRHDTAFVGCGGIRRFAESACEMKRLYVIPTMRGARIGRAVADALIAHARDVGYETMLLDTLPSMKSAQRLYVALGFIPTGPYRYNPVPGATFWRLPLR